MLEPLHAPAGVNSTRILVDGRHHSGSNGRYGAEHTRTIAQRRRTARHLPYRKAAPRARTSRLSGACTCWSGPCTGPDDVLDEGDGSAVWSGRGTIRVGPPSGPRISVPPSGGTTNALTLSMWRSPLARVSAASFHLVDPFRSTARGSLADNTLPWGRGSCPSDSGLSRGARSCGRVRVWVRLWRRCGRVTGGRRVVARAPPSRTCARAGSSG